MARKRYTSEQIIHKLREAEVELGAIAPAPRLLAQQSDMRFRKVQISVQWDGKTKLENGELYFRADQVEVVAGKVPTQTMACSDIRSDQ